MNTTIYVIEQPVDQLILNIILVLTLMEKLMIKIPN